MIKRTTLIAFAVFSITALAILPALAQPTRQDDGNLATPTPYPVDNIDYELTTVGGQTEVLTFPGAEGNGLTISETTAVSEYPRGMRFTMQAESANGPINDVTLFIRFAHGSGNRFPATFDAEQNVWVAHPWATGEGQPAWTHFDFYWRVRDTSDVSLDTEPQTTDYSDPTRTWFRVESEYMVFYWFGFLEDNPEYVAENVTMTVAATEPRRIAGFGGPLSYKPINVAYPTRETLGEIFGSGQSNSNAAGWTSDELGMTIQHISMPTDDWFERQQDCVWLRPREERTEQIRADGLIFSTVPHEITHLYQYDKGVSGGPSWWSEGQADYFTYAAGQYDRRLRNLATLQDFPNMEGTVPAFTFEADGCYAFAYDAGVSFINWTLTNYGGLDTHLKIIQAFKRTGDIVKAFEEATGDSFLNIQNGWRVYLGLEPLTLADVDPASALEPAIDPLVQVGDTIAITSPQVPLKREPTPFSITAGACFNGTQAIVLAMGSLEGINYYQLDCFGMKGWVTDDQLR